jgi:hypothetical protein
MSNRIIDTIGIQEDTQPVRNEWEWLVEPLASSIKLPVRNMPNELYIDSIKSSDFFLDHSISTDNINCLPNDWLNRYELMVEDSILPLILIADIGVGKTSWLERFKYFLDETKNVVYYYYNHHTEKGRPDGSHLEPQVKLHCLLYAELLNLIQDTCRKNNVNGLNIFKYDVNQAADDPKYINHAMTTALKEACTYLKKHCDVKIFFIIDNLDEYSKDIQVKAVDIADHISTWDNIYPLVALRPETYLRTQTHLKHPRQFAITPVSLNSMLNKRFEYLWKNGGRESIKNIINKFKMNNISLSILWSEETIDKDPNSLKRLHKKIIDVLTENKILEEALQKLHNYNMREILAVVSKLLMSGFFSEEIIQDLKNDTNNKGKLLKNDREAVITTYLRGPFFRYRGPSNDYPVKMLNVFDVPGISNHDMLITVRIMQILGKAHSVGFTVKKIVADLTEIEYKESDIYDAIGFLAKFGFVLDIKEQKPWGKTEDVELEDNDMFILAPAGNYLITKLFDEFAFRYCEAMADIMYRSRNDSIPWSKDRDYASLVENVIGIVKLIVSASEYELKRILEIEQTVEKRRLKFEQFKKNFLSQEIVGYDFLLTITKGCKIMANYFTTQKYRHAADYDSQVKLKVLNNQINSQVDKAISIYAGHSYINL